MFQSARYRMYLTYTVLAQSQNLKALRHHAATVLELSISVCLDNFSCEIINPWPHVCVAPVVETAIERGANAVIGLRFDTSAPIGTAHIEILAYGTAVNIKKDNGKGQNWDGGHKHVSFKNVSDVMPSSSDSVAHYNTDPYAFTGKLA